MTTMRGWKNRTTCDEVPQADAHADHEGDEAHAGVQGAVTEDVLHVEADQHGEGEQHATGQEDRRERGDPVALVEQVERHHRVLGAAFGYEEGQCRRQPRPHLSPA